MASLGVTTLLVFSAVFVISQIPAAHATNPPLVFYPNCSDTGLGSSLPTPASTCSPIPDDYSGTNINVDFSTPFVTGAYNEIDTTSVVYVTLYVASTDLYDFFSPTISLLGDYGGGTVQLGDVTINNLYFYGYGSCSTAMQVKAEIPAELLFAYNAYQLVTTGFNSGVQFCTGYPGEVSLMSINQAPTTTTVSCSPALVHTSSLTTCTASVSGDSPTGSVQFATSSSTGTFTPSSGLCTLSSGACSVKYSDTTGGFPLISATYQGDPNNPASYGSVTLDVGSAATNIQKVFYPDCTYTSLDSGVPPVSASCVPVGDDFSGNPNVDFSTAFINGAYNVIDTQATVYATFYLASTDTTDSFSPTFYFLGDYGGGTVQAGTATISPFSFTSDQGSCSTAMQLKVEIPANLYLTFNAYQLITTGLPTDVQFCTGYPGEVSVMSIDQVSTTTVSCFPPSVDTDAATTCTASVTGASPTGAIQFTTSSSTGAFNPSNGACTLSSGSCSVEYSDSSASDPQITASYAGDANNPPSAGSFDLNVVSPSGGSGATTTVTSTVTSTSTATTIIITSVPPPPNVTVTTTSVSTVVAPVTTTVTSIASTTTLSSTTTSTVVAPVTTTTTNVVSTSTSTATTTIATEGSLETTILNNQGTFNPGDTIASLLYGLGSSLTSVSNTIATDFGSVATSLTNIQSAIGTLQTGQTSLTTTITTDFADDVSSLSHIQTTLTTLSTNIATDFTTVDTNLASIASSLSSIQSSISSLSSAQSHSALTGSGSGETVLSYGTPSYTIYTTSNDKVAIVGVSVNATQTSGHGFYAAGPLQVRFYTDPSHPNVYVQQTVSIYDFGLGNGNLGDGYVGTGAAWKIVLVAAFPYEHSSDTITANWAVSSMGPP